MFFKRLYCLLFGCSYVWTYLYMIRICHVCEKCHIRDIHLQRIRNSLYYYPDIFLSKILVYSISDNYEGIEELVSKDYLEFKILDKKSIYSVTYSKYLQLGGKGSLVRDMEKCCIVTEKILLRMIKESDDYSWRNIIMALKYGVLLCIDTTSIEGYTILILR